MSWRRWKRRLRYGEAVVLLALLTALLAVGLSVLARSYYHQDLKGYHPLDLSRGKLLEKKERPSLPMDSSH
ncbi:MAG: hypothetical protein ABW047_01065 [Nitrospiraceae bacterium]